MTVTYYNTKNFYLFRKPHNIPTTFGENKSFLDFLVNHKSSKIKKIFNKQKKSFTKDQEYGLCNRLDNPTSGLIYFAKNQTTYNNYKIKQNKNKITKTYIATIKWHFWPNRPIFSYDKNFLTQSINRLIDNGQQTSKKCIVNFPIKHHRHLSDRMVWVYNQKQLSKTRWKKHYRMTYIQRIYYDPKDHKTTLKIKITKGIRHQIRVHLSSIWYPIIGDWIYNSNYKKNSNTPLNLWSIWVKI